MEVLAPSVFFFIGMSDATGTGVFGSLFVVVTSCGLCGVRCTMHHLMRSDAAHAVKVRV